MTCTIGSLDVPAPGRCRDISPILHAVAWDDSSLVLLLHRISRVAPRHDAACQHLDHRVPLGGQLTGCLVAKNWGVLSIDAAIPYHIAAVWPPEADIFGGMKPWERKAWICCASCWRPRVSCRTRFRVAGGRGMDTAGARGIVGGGGLADPWVDCFWFSGGLPWLCRCF